MAEGNGSTGNDLLVQMIGRLDILTAEVKKGFESVNGRLDTVNKRLDAVVDNTGGHYRELRDRVEALERKAG